ncbi:MAG: hypothetical protein ABSB71_06130 [Candidatus Bathyarchaeia archaeon]|jgi:hypothetical protein
MGPNGEIIMYPVSNGYLAQWNSSNLWNWNILVGGGVPQADVSTTPFSITTFGFTGPVTTTYTNTVNGGSTGTTNGNLNRYDWNVSLPSTLPRSFTELAAYSGNMILCMNGTTSGLGNRLLIDYLYGWSTS